ncbi:VIR protein [Plasmodium vivax]|uniref:VIR protein n=1 Tax=Plasmodium vivax TaxID=5855 RepID=A0A1G4EHZ5_PLAVI|nr:VIR protein [Plasmodium vivax]
MAGCSGHDVDYITYDCYKELKHYFHEKVKLSEDSAEILRKALSTVTNKHPDMNSIPEIFKSLGTFYTGDHAFSSIGQIPSCIYVNYWLNKKLRNVYYNVPEHKFNVFKEFSDKFAKERNSIKNSCNLYMKYYNEDKWDRIKFLYEWYDKFEELISSKKHKTDLECNDITILRKEFNEFTKKHDRKDEELMNKLIKFKDLLPTKLSEINSNCKDEIKYFQYPPQEEERRAAVKAQEEQQRAAIKAQEEQQRAAEQAKALRQTDQRTLIIPPNHEQTEPLTDGSRNNLLLETHRRSPEMFPPKVHEDSERQVFTGPTRFIPGSFREHTDGLEYQLEKNTELENANMSPDYRPGVFGTLKNTFTDVLGQVDPVPVVGVSGGMGALFLLFRLEPSLEEDEDAYVEFLVVPMDHSQENSQIFKIMKVGILDMAQ